MAARLPGVELGSSYGTPCLHVRKKFLARLKEDGQTIAVRVDFLDRDVLLQLDPAAFFLTDHYREYPAMLVRLRQVRPQLLAELLEHAWRRQAPKTLVASHPPERAVEPAAAPRPRAKVRRPAG